MPAIILAVWGPNYTVHNTGTQTPIQSLSVQNTHGNFLSACMAQMQIYDINVNTPYQGRGRMYNSFSKCLQRNTYCDYYTICPQATWLIHSGTIPLWVEVHYHNNRKLLHICQIMRTTTWCKTNPKVQSPHKNKPQESKWPWCLQPK